eukprot:Lankesteria_metandrocarpae@DN4809_c0_g1_i1.p1
MEKNQVLCLDRDDYKSKLQTQLLKTEKLEDDVELLRKEVQMTETESSKQLQTLKWQMEEKLKDQRDALNVEAQQAVTASNREIESLTRRLDEVQQSFDDLESIHSHCPDPSTLAVERQEEANRISLAVRNLCRPVEERTKQLEAEKVSMLDEFEIRNSALKSDWQESMQALTEQHKQETIAREKTYNASLKEKREQLAVAESRQRLAVERAAAVVRAEVKQQTEKALWAADGEHSRQYELLRKQQEITIKSVKHRAESSQNQQGEKERITLKRQLDEVHTEMEQLRLSKDSEIRSLRETAAREAARLGLLLEKMETRKDTSAALGDLEKEMVVKHRELAVHHDRIMQLESLLQYTEQESERRHEALQAANDRLDAMLRRNAELEKHSPQQYDEEEITKLRREGAEATHNLNSKNDALKRAGRAAEMWEASHNDLADDVKRLTAENGHLMARVKLTNDLREKASLLALENRKHCNEARTLKEQLAAWQESRSESGDNFDEQYMSAKIVRLETALKTVTHQRDVVIQEKEMLAEICVENEAKQMTIDQLKHRIAEKDDEIDRKAVEIAEAERTSPRNEGDVGAIAELQRRVDLLSAEKSCLVTDREVLQDELEAERSQLTARLELKERQLQSLTSTHEHARELLRRNTELEDLIDKLRREREIDFDESQRRLTAEHEERLSEFHSSRIDVLKSQLRSEYQTFIDELSTQGTEKDVIVEKLRQRIEHLESDKDNKDAKQAMLSQDLTEMELKNKMLSSEIKATQQRLASRRDHEAAMERRTAELEATISQLEQLLQRSSDLEHIIMDLQQEKKESIKNIQYELQLVTDENDRSSMALEALHSHQQLYERRLADLNSELEAVRKEKSILERQVGLRIHVDAHRSTDRVKELIAELGEAREQHKQAVNQMSGLQERNQKLETYLHTIDEQHQEDIQKLGKAINILKEELQSKENTIQAVRRHGSTQDEEVRTLRNALRRLAATPSSPRSTSRLSLSTTTTTAANKSFTLPPGYSSEHGYTTTAAMGGSSSAAVDSRGSSRRRYSYPLAGSSGQTTTTAVLHEDFNEYSLGRLRDELGSTTRGLKDTGTVPPTGTVLP